MKLLTETIDLKDLKILTEGEGNQKTVKIEGPFLQAEVKNKNGRIYPLDICEREVKAFNEEKIKTNRAVGELEHPTSPQINLDRVSHKIEKLEMRKDVGFGLAKILETPMGKIAKTLILEGIVLGVSTRGLGSVDNEKVNDDFKLITIDIVADPSAPEAYVDGILENKEYILEGNQIVEVAVKALQKKMDNKGIGINANSQAVYGALMAFLEEIKGNI